MFKKAEWLAVAKDRTAMTLLVVLVLQIIVIIITTLARLHSSDVQIPVRYSGYGTANIYRGQWYSVWTFSFFAVLITALNGFMAIKIYQASKLIGRGVLGFTVFILVVEFFVLNAIFNLSPSV